MDYELIKRKKEMFDKGYIYCEEYKGFELYFYTTNNFIFYAIYDKMNKKFIEQDIMTKLSCKRKITKFLKIIEG